MKYCPKCKMLKSLGEFHRSSKSPDGLQGYCKACMKENNKPTQKQRSAKWYSTKGKESIRARRLLQLYGITRDEYNEMLAQQNGVCYICGGDNDGSELAVDHSHKTGKVRKLLCHRCNLMISSEDPEKLEAGANYLREHEEGGLAQYAHRTHIDAA